VDALRAMEKDTQVGKFSSGASLTEALNFNDAKAVCNAFHLCFARMPIFTSNRSSKFWTVKNG
jgi:hypothetical protein